MNSLLQRPITLQSNILSWMMCISLLTTQNCTCTKSSSDTTNTADKNQQNIPALSYGLKSPQQLKDAQREIQIEFNNQGKEATLPGKAKLICTRQQGKEAQLSHQKHPLPAQSSGKYVINLPSISPSKPLHYTLVLDPHADLATTWMLELQYNSQPMGKPMQITWETTHAVVLKDFQYDKQTGEVTAKVLNRGDKPVTNIRINPTTKNDKVQLPAYPIEVNALAPYNGKVITLVDDINLPMQGSTTIELAISYDQDGTAIQLPPISHTFTRTPLQASLKVSELENRNYCWITWQVHPKDIQNGGPTLYLQYENISQEVNSQQVTLHQKVVDKIKLDETNQSMNLGVDFFNAEEATFRFELLEAYKENGTEKYFPLQAIEKNFQKMMDFSIKVQNLVPQRLNNLADKTQATTYITYGAHPVKMNIYRNDGGNGYRVNQELLTLGIQNEGDVQVATMPQGPPIQKLTHPDLKWEKDGNQSSELDLYILPTSPAAQEGKVTLQVQYNGQAMGAPAVIHWKQNVFSIEADGVLIGDLVGTIKIHSLGEVADWSEYAISITSPTAGIVPQFAKSNNSKSPVNQALENNFIEYHIPNLPNGIQQAILDIVLSKGKIELAKKQVTWVKAGIFLKVSTNERGFRHDGSVTIFVENNNIHHLNLRDIQVVVTNTAGLNLTLGNCAGTEIKETLAAITQTNQLQARKELTLELQLTDQATAPEDIAGVKIDFVDGSKNVVLKTVYLVYEPDLIKRSKELTNSGSKQEIKYVIGLQKLLPIYQKQIKQARDLQQQVPALDSRMRSIEQEISQLIDLQNMEILQIQSSWNQHKKDIREAMSKIEPITQHEYLREDDNLDITLAKLVHIGDNIDDSIKSAYITYTQILISIKSFFTDNEITDLTPAVGDLPIVQELKKLYQEIETKRAALIQLVQDALGNYAQEEASRAIQEKDAEDLHQAINKQRDLIKILIDDPGNFLKVEINEQEEDWILPAQWEELLVTNLKNLIDTFAKSLDLALTAQDKLRIATGLLQALEQKKILGEVLKGVLSQVAAPETKKAIQKNLLETTLLTLERLQTSQGQDVKIEIDGTQVKVEEKTRQLRQQLETFN